MVIRVRCCEKSSSRIRVINLYVLVEISYMNYECCLIGVKLLYGIGIGRCKSRVRKKGFIKLLYSRCFKC